jgi:hypothetical protein
MARWRVLYNGKHLCTVEALDERSAIAEVAKQFHITPARRYQIMVTKIEPGTASEKKPRRRNLMRFLRCCRRALGGPE